MYCTSEIIHSNFEENKQPVTTKCISTKEILDKA